MDIKSISSLALLISMLFIASYPLISQDDEEDKEPLHDLTIFDHLNQSDYTPTFKIHTSVKELMKRKSIEEEYYIPGQMTISQEDGQDLSFEMKMKVRGNTRKKVCRYPPFKLNLKGGELEEAGFNSSIDKLKLVLQCESGSSAIQQMLKEKLIYDMYSLVDTNAMHAKVIKLELWEGDKLKDELDAFLVEDEEQYADRKGALVLETGRVTSGALFRDQYFKLCFFQYMISNCDWSVRNKHNIKIIKYPSLKRAMAVPYDFDYAGLVNNRYAVPPEHFPINSIRERYFMVKLSMSPEEIDEMIGYYQNKKGDFLAVVDQSEYLSDRSKKSIVSFLNGFYKDLGNKKKVTRGVVPK